MIGTTDYKTMRVQGKIKNQLISILIDTGSTHNFVDQEVVKKLRVRLKNIQSFMVTVANSDKLKAQQRCPSLTWEVQGIQLKADFLVIPLKGCDMVLGVQWLITLGPILWNFKKLTMQFTWEHQHVIWRGQVNGHVIVMSKK